MKKKFLKVDMPESGFITLGQCGVSYSLDYIPKMIQKAFNLNSRH